MPGHLVLSDLELPGRLLDGLDVPYTCTKGETCTCTTAWWPEQQRLLTRIRDVACTCRGKSRLLNEPRHSQAAVQHHLPCAAALIRRVEVRLSWSNKEKGVCSIKVSGVALTCTTRQLPTVCDLICVCEGRYLSTSAGIICSTNSAEPELGITNTTSCRWTAKVMLSPSWNDNISSNAVQPVGEDVLHKLQMKKDRWKRYSMLEAVESLLWGKRPRYSMKQRVCAAAGWLVSSMLHDASLAVEDLSVVIAPGQPPTVCAEAFPASSSQASLLMLQQCTGLHRMDCAGLHFTMGLSCSVCPSLSILASSITEACPCRPWTAEADFHSCQGPTASPTLSSAMREGSSWSAEAMVNLQSTASRWH